MVRYSNFKKKSIFQRDAWGFGGMEGEKKEIRVKENERREKTREEEWGRRERRRRKENKLKKTKGATTDEELLEFAKRYGMILLFF